MFCENCGKELKENEVCECQKQEQATEATTDEVLSEGKSVTGISQEMLLEKVKELVKDKKALSIVVGLVVVLIGIVVFATRPEKIYLEDYLVEELSVKGFEGYGSLESYNLFDSSAFMEDVCADAMGNNAAITDDFTESEIESAFLEFGVQIEAYDAIDQSIELAIYVNGKLESEPSNLKNGDKVEVKVSSDIGQSKDFNKKFVAGSREYEIISLEKGKVISPFNEEYFSISFTGGEGAGKINWEVKNEHELAQYLTYKLISEKRTDLNNGDKVTFEVTYDEESLLNKGYALSETTKEFTVEGLGQYITSLKEIPEELLAQLKNDSATKLAMNEAAGDYEKPVYQKIYFLSKKEGAGNGSFRQEQPQNLLFIVYSTKTRSWVHDANACVCYSELTTDGETILFGGYKNEADGATIQYYSSSIFEGYLEDYAEIFNIETIE